MSAVKNKKREIFLRELARQYFSVSHTEGDCYFWIQPNKIYTLETRNAKLVLSEETKKLAEFEIAELKQYQREPKQLLLF